MAILRLVNLFQVQSAAGRSVPLSHFAIGGFDSRLRLPSHSTCELAPCSAVEGPHSDSGISSSRRRCNSPAGAVVVLVRGERKVPSSFTSLAAGDRDSPPARSPARAARMLPPPACLDTMTLPVDRVTGFRFLISCGDDDEQAPTAQARQRRPSSRPVRSFTPSLFNATYAHQRFRAKGRADFPRCAKTREILTFRKTPNVAIGLGRTSRSKWRNLRQNVALSLSSYCLIVTRAYSRAISADSAGFSAA